MTQPLLAALVFGGSLAFVAAAVVWMRRADASIVAPPPQVPQMEKRTAVQSSAADTEAFALMSQGILPSPGQIRALAAWFHAECAAAASRGENVHQLAIDFDDRLCTHMSSLSVDDQIAFTNRYTRETDAIVDHEQPKIAAAMQAKAKAEVEGATIGYTLGTVVLTVVVFFIIREFL